MIKKINNYQIKTPHGWCDFEGIKKTIIPYHFVIYFNNGKILKGSENHLVQLEGGEFWEISLLYPGDILKGNIIVDKVECIGEPLEVYDVIKVKNKDNSFYSEDIIHHNCAFIEKIEPLWISAQQTLATGGQCIALSSPNGTGNWFYGQWIKAQNKENKFIPLRLPWTVHPERDQSWRDEQDTLLGKRHAAQECDADFKTSGESVIEIELLNWYRDTYVKDPIEKRGIDSALWIWDYVDYQKSYMIVADVARGDGADYSAFHIIDIDSSKQVAEFKHQISPKDFSQLLYLMGIEYNNALIVVESNSYGWEVLGRLIEKNYSNIYYSPKIDYTSNNLDEYLYKYSEGTDMTPGFTMSLKTRPLVISKLMSYINDRSIEIKSIRTIDELKTFIWKNGRPQAQAGHNDDLITSLSIGLFLRETSLNYQKTSIELSRASVNSIQTQHQSMGVYSNNPYGQNPYKMDLGHAGVEDISWLLS